MSRSSFCLTTEPTKEDPRFQVWLGNGVDPGVHLASLDTVGEANRACILLAMHYRVRARTLDVEANR
jgi:hypothetical protein